MVVHTSSPPTQHHNKVKPKPPKRHTQTTKKKEELNNDILQDPKNKQVVDDEDGVNNEVDENNDEDIDEPSDEEDVADENDDEDIDEPSDEEDVVDQDDLADEKEDDNNIVQQNEDGKELNIDSKKDEGEVNDDEFSSIESVGEDDLSVSENDSNHIEEQLREQATPASGTTEPASTPPKQRSSQHINPNFRGKPENYDPHYKYNKHAQTGGKRTQKHRWGGLPPSTNNGKPSRVQRLLQTNPIADKLLTKEECNRSEFCQWDDEAQKCKGLSIDYAVRKMSIMRAKLNQRFLDMLQVSAVDCLVFRELHDDRSRQCFVPDKNSTTADVRAYRGFNEADYEETEETVQKQTRTVKASNATKTLKCRILKTEAECAAEPPFGGPTR